MLAAKIRWRGLWTPFTAARFDELSILSAAYGSKIRQETLTPIAPVAVLNELYILFSHRHRHTRRKYRAFFLTAAAASLEFLEF